MKLLSTHRFIFILFFLLVTLFISTTNFTLAVEPADRESIFENDRKSGCISSYTPIVRIPGIEGGCLNTEGYVTALYYLSITVAALLAVYKIMEAGIKLMFDGVVVNKSEARSQIQGAVFGLLIVLSAVLILRTINVNLTYLNIFGNAPSLSAIEGAWGPEESGFQVGFDPEVLGSTINWDNSSLDTRKAFTDACTGIVNITSNAAGSNIATCVSSEGVIIDPDLTKNTTFNTDKSTFSDSFQLEQDQISRSVGTTVYENDVRGMTSLPIDTIPGDDEYVFAETLQPACEEVGGSHIGITLNAGQYKFWCVGNVVSD